MERESNLPGTDTDKFFEIKELMRNQITMLDTINPQLMKIAKINGKQDTTYITPDSTGWAKELEIFLNVSINEPALLDQYTSETKTTDKYRILNYEGIDKDDLEIEYLNIYYDRESDHLEKIEAYYKEISPLFKTRRYLYLWFRHEGQHPRIVRYAIEGQQKMILKDTVTFSVNAEVLY